MSKKKKIVIISLIGIAILFFLIALLLGSNKKYMITFNSDGGSYVSSQEIKKGGYGYKPNDPIKEGYEFVEWQLNGKTFDFTSKINKNITLKAVWQLEKQSYKVELTLDGKSQTIEVKDGEIIDLDELIFEEKEGYKIEWYSNDEIFDIETYKITKNISLNGKYIELKSFTITFDSDGGSKVESQKVYENKKVNQPQSPTKNGYVFDAWYLNNSKYDFNEKVTKDITLKAKWIEDKNLKKYEVKFDSEGGSNVASQTIIDGKTATKPNNPTKNGYRFIEWQLNGKTYDFSSKVTSNITLKAVWQQVVIYTVSFNTDGGTKYPNQIVESGNKATNPGSPTKSGYVFTGWDFDFNTPITNNKTINAKWRELYKYTVRFNLNGGSCSNCENQIITEGGKATNPGKPTRSGYNFLGWDFDFSKVITSDITINAKWQQKSYTIRKTSADNFSPDVILSVEEDGVVIPFSNIKYENTIICTYSSPAVNREDISGITTLNVTLLDGTVVSATVSN